MRSLSRLEIKVIIVCQAVFFASIVASGTALGDECAKTSYSAPNAPGYFVLKAGPYRPHRESSYKTPASLKAHELWKMKFDGFDVYAECKGAKPKRDRTSGQLRFETPDSGAGRCTVFAPVNESDQAALNAYCAVTPSEAKIVRAGVKKDRENYWARVFGKKKGKKTAAVKVEPVSEGGYDLSTKCTAVKDAVFNKINLKSAVGEQCNFKPEEMGKKSLCAIEANCQVAAEPSYLSTIMCLSDEKGDCPDVDTCLRAKDVTRNPEVSVAGVAETAPEAPVKSEDKGKAAGAP